MYYENRRFILLCLISTLLTIKVLGNNSECRSHQTCTECIRTPNCMWCSEERESSDKDTQPRCMEEGSATKVKSNSQSWCPRNMIVNPRRGVEIIENVHFSSDEDEQVQVRPQRIKMSLRVGQEETIKIGYKQAQDYPVDLYFLMDLSASMEMHKDNLSKLGKQLKNTMEKLTSNFRLGFGSFVDKVILPMTASQPEWLKQFCKLSLNSEPCAPPYGYKHQMTLTKEHSQFRANVESAPISGNVDHPEGGLDALMQAMVCWDRIGWRNNSRHIIIYSSDANYHIAGDGRLAGIIEPNDEQCHMNASGFYTHSELLDYPSISQINKQARENNVNIIFAVVKTMQDTYKALSSRIDGSNVGILDENPNNVVDLVRQNYEKLTNTVTMKDNATGMLELKFRTKCLNTDKKASLQERNECSGVRKDTPLEFEVTIKAVDCPERMEDWRQVVSIQPQGVNERIIIDVELSCDCPCSRPGHERYVEKSPKCHLSGNLTCGVCSCNEGHYGKRCNCQGDNEKSQSSGAETSCRDGNATVSCSGRGVCSCGACKCEPGPNEGDEFSGEFCQCDNFSCKRHNNLVCGGPNNGKCVCGTCRCNPGLGGEACGCPISNSTCIPSGENTEICNGFGDCVCGKCECTKDKRRSGQYCEKCLTCPSSRCDELKDCLECEAYGTGPEYAEGEERCPNCVGVGSTELTVTMVDRIEADPSSTNSSADSHTCVARDASGCTFTFTYESVSRGDMKGVIIDAEKEKKCVLPPVSAYGVAGGAIIATLFLGLLILLIWKALTMFHDHREWVKFEKERVSAKWDAGENPLFKEPTTSFKNPTFDGVKG